jgi:radical SAM superfamily enzyme YgiQ (UPF0313 family)
LRPTGASPRDFRGDWQAERALYLKHERGHLSHKGPVRVEVALGFPNRYTVGMSNLGFQAVYALLNSQEEVRCERTFLWETDGAGTLESGRPLNQFSIVAFSVPFELDYINLLSILRRARIPLLASQREAKDPIIVVGGACASLNPEPMAPFVDLFVVGEAEDVLPALIGILKESDSREERIEKSLRLSGVYVPSYYQVSYLPDGPLRAMRPTAPAPRKVARQWVRNLDLHPTISSIVSPLSHLKDMSLLEVQRGCGYRCRFCAMGQIYRPLRHRSAKALGYWIGKAAEKERRVGLVGSALAELPGLLDLCRQMSAQGLELGLASLRADRLDVLLAGELARLGVKTLTIAPEVGTERLRRVINKSVSAQDVLRTASLAAQTGIFRLKLYFLVGLPWERQEDLTAIVSLVEQVRQTTGLKAVTVSVSPFVPKASTPFQWAAMDRETVLIRKIRYLAGRFRPMKRVSFSGESPRRSVWQGILARGDRRVGMVLWHHLMHDMTWAKAWQQMEIDGEFFVHRERDRRETLPWDFIDHGISKQSLWAGYQRARMAAE